MAFLTINLEDENGAVIDSIEDNGILHQYIPAIDDKKYYCIKYINPWGDTVFNYLQMNDFIAEIIEIKNNSQSKDLENLVNNIVHMAERCKEIGHAYLKFIGD